MIAVIVNPRSKKNRALPGRAAALERIVGAGGLVFETAGTADVGRAVAEGLARGVRTWVSDGGDGALHWVLNALHERRALPGGAVLVPTGGGTIDFVARKADVRGSPDEVVARVARAADAGEAIPAIELPTLLLEGRDEAGARFERIGFLAAIAGVARRYFDEYARAADPGVLAGLGIFARTLGSAALGRVPLVPRGWREYGERVLRPEEALVRMDGRELEGRTWRAIAAGAFPCTVGLMSLFPLAGGGRIHAIAGDPGALEIARGLPALFRGGRLGDALIEAAVERLEVEARGPEPLAPFVDGEPLGAARRLEVRPGPAVWIGGTYFAPSG